MLCEKAETGVPEVSRPASGGLDHRPAPVTPKSAASSPQHLTGFGLAAASSARGWRQWHHLLRLLALSNPVSFCLRHRSGDAVQQAQHRIYQYIDGPDHHRQDRGIEQGGEPVLREMLVVAGLVLALMVP